MHKAKNVKANGNVIFTDVFLLIKCDSGPQNQGQFFKNKMEIICHESCMIDVWVQKK